MGSPRSDMGREGIRRWRETELVHDCIEQCVRTVVTEGSRSGHAPLKDCTEQRVHTVVTDDPCLALSRSRRQQSHAGGNAPTVVLQLTAARRQQPHPVVATHG
ncbi:hypothetical protein BHE74_00027724 [Ensete ventricosum]|nr:hypothetical protein BHE74_00027724 [Ensete ventricosum]